MSAAIRAWGPRRTTPTVCASSGRLSRRSPSLCRDPPSSTPRRGTSRSRSMRLEMGSFPVRTISFGPATRWDAGRLTVDRAAALAEVRRDPRIVTAGLEIAAPGDAVRIWPVRDVIEPRFKVEGPGQCYPGICGRDVATVGEGRTHRLSGMGVVEVSSVNWHDSGGDFVETYLDMSGPYAEMYPYHRLHLLCLVVEADRALGSEARNDTVHKAALVVSDALAAATAGLTPPER